MSFRKLLLAGAALAASTAAVTPANASIIDRPHFKVLGVVIVWAAEDGTGNVPIATDFIINDQVGAGDTDLIGGNTVDGRTVVTGSLTPTADSASTTAIGDVLTIQDSTSTIGTITPTTTTFSAFSVANNAGLSAGPMEYNSSFYVASNTAFSINGEASATTQSGDFDLDDIGYSMGVTVAGADSGLTFGTNAQDPNGTFPAFANLAAMTTAAPVFEGTRRTAASTGSIVDQSVRFDATYTLGAGGVYDLSQGAGEIEAAVVYTVFVP